MTRSLSARCLSILKILSQSYTSLLLESFLERPFEANALSPATIGRVRTTEGGAEITFTLNELRVNRHGGNQRKGNVGNATGCHNQASAAQGMFAKK